MLKKIPNDVSHSIFEYEEDNNSHDGFMYL